MKPGREPAPAAERGPETTSEGTDDNRQGTSAALDVQSTYALVSTIEEGTYSAEPSTVGAVLLARHPSTDRWVAERSLADFARSAMEATWPSWWWPEALNASEHDLEQHDVDYVSVAWSKWCAGRDPWGRP